MGRQPLTPFRLATAATALTLASLAPAGAVVGLLLCIPVLLGSVLERRRDLLGLAGLCVGGFAAATSLVHLAGTPLWTRDRLGVLLAVCVAAGVSLVLHASRSRVLADGKQARTASEMNRLLVSLLAHDLRSPLVLADQGLEYVEESVAGGYPIDRSLVADLRARLQRSLRAIGLVLELARGDAARPGEPPAPPAAISLRDEIDAEVASFRYEAEVRGKHLVADLADLPPGLTCRVDALVLRQTLAIALDNAVRYADPGIVRVSARLRGSQLEVRVEDPGPGLEAHRVDDDRAHGTGMGLRLCAALLTRAGGNLAVQGDSPTGTVVAIRLPAAAIARTAVPGEPVREPVPA